MLERKHVEAIASACKKLEPRYNVALGEYIHGSAVVLDAIQKALAACDQSPCVWTEDGGRVLKTTCGHYWQTLEDGDRVDFPYCPYCGRKIAEAPRKDET